MYEKKFNQIIDNLSDEIIIKKKREKMIEGTKKPRARKSKQFGENRVCQAEKCEQILSKYNKQEYCHFIIIRLSTLVFVVGILL